MHIGELGNTKNEPLATKLRYVLRKKGVRGPERKDVTLQSGKTGLVLRAQMVERRGGVKVEVEGSLSGGR